MKRYGNLAISLILLTLVMPGLTWARSVNKTDAEKAVKGWLKTDPKPMNAILGAEIAMTDVFKGSDGKPVYYIVYLDTSGFVIVSADDLVEPVVGFVTGDALYDPSPENVLGALVSRDLPGRVEVARKLQKELDAGKTFTEKGAVLEESEAVKARGKWKKLEEYADSGAVFGLPSVSDVRVAPLTLSKWGQSSVCGSYCFNYYTPNHYVCGCVATAMAQHMRFHEYPTEGIGRIRFGSYYTRGGDGEGGPYNWSLMMLVPNCSITEAQRQAIGALCYDAGVAAKMSYASGGSGAYMHDAKAAMLYPFMYSNAVMGGNESTNIPADVRNVMMNPNLDAGLPVQIAIYGGVGGHAVVADGYGYQSSTLYHHINMGWNGYDDAWYNLPIVDASYYFSSLVACIYNVYISGSGEIISGRVTYSSGLPFPGATVTATGSGGPYTATTNDKGIYALVKVKSASTYTVSVTAAGCTFTPASQSVTTGTSTDGVNTTGNKWGINFTTSCSPPSPPPAPATISYPTSSSTGQYTVSWSSSSGATSYQLERSNNGGGSWTQIYSGANTSYSESVGDGSYRYRVKATNAGGSSSWTTGTWDCVVSIPPPSPPLPPASISYPTNSTGKHTVSWASSSGATSYKLERSSDGGGSWTQIYSGANTSHQENVGDGSYRYRVKAANVSGESDWKTGTFDCVVFVPPPVTCELVAGTAAGWNFRDLASDIARNYTIDYNDLNVLGQYWLDSSCGDANQWCEGADIDSSTNVDFVDYSLLAKDWTKVAGEGVLLQTIYGTGQDASGTITANNYRAVSQNKGLAMAFKVPANTALDKGIFKVFSNPWRAGEQLRIRLFNVTGKNYLVYNHSGITKSDPGGGGVTLIDQIVTTSSSVPYHSELGDGRQYSDMVINFGPMALTAGEYFITFDAQGPSNTYSRGFAP